MSNEPIVYSAADIDTALRQVERAAGLYEEFVEQGKENTKASVKLAQRVSDLEKLVNDRLVRQEAEISRLSGEIENAKATLRAEFFKEMRDMQRLDFSAPSARTNVPPQTNGGGDT